MIGRLALAYRRPRDRDRRRERQRATADAVAGWTESLAGALAAGAGLRRAIIAAAAVAGAPIRPQVQALAARLEGGERLASSLRAFADQLADPAADLAVAVLVTAAEHPTWQVGPVVGRLARVLRAHVETRRRALANATRAAALLRAVAAGVAIVAAASVACARPVLRFYDSPSGRLALLVVGVVFAAGLGWLLALARPPAAGRRVLARAAEPADGATPVAVTEVSGG